MKLFFSEFHNNYSTYTFSYAVYCLLEKVSELSRVYAQGFLPYSSDISIDRDVFYLCRSVRVSIKNFTDTSENRRVDRKVEPLGITTNCISLIDFDSNSKGFCDFVESYTAERFSGGHLSAERLSYILRRSYVTHVLTFDKGNEIVGYVLIGLEGDSMHYYYAFFNTSYLREYSLGKWLMWKSIHLAKEQGLRYVYLGTCYGEKALYKVKDHSGVEFFDGITWNADISLITSAMRTDGNNEVESDHFKLPENTHLKKSLQSLLP